MNIASHPVFLLLLLSYLVPTALFSQSFSSNINSSGLTVSDRVSPPDSFVRPPYPTFTYQSYLQGLAMKHADAEVMKYDGYKKQYDCYAGVLQMEFDMDQDMIHGEHIIEYIRARYLYTAGKYDLLRFSYQDNRSISFAEWGAGARFVLQDSTYVLDTIASQDYSEESFQQYMYEIFLNTNTNSLTSDTKVISPNELNIGDVLVQPASYNIPGHAVLVIDMAVNPFTGEKLLLLAQGYDPTQDVHLLKNLHEPSISPWYRVQEDDHYFTTAQWTFRKKHIRRFRLNANALNVENSIELESE